MRIINFTSSGLKRVAVEQFVRRHSEHFSPPFATRVESVADYVKKLCRFGTIHIGLADDRISGMIAYYANDMVDKFAYISYLCVCDEYRNTTLAGRLIKACVDYSNRKNMVKILVNTEMNNTRAIRFYGKNGFFVTQNWVKEGIEKVELERYL